ncbi:hypothetical protein FA15DRAFT_591487 [Coprinopsis marcescibilis]|uniref:Arrestin-like N-terminal domain-containing protein n=1 Tax=Coprinopsis marcescibilis TaxID=230819 RepID=A0A5C3KYM3_COPMA|nr:hypothetical protein FA15DRAFT_591487 [Coprinopsis marcescibilis]
MASSSSLLQLPDYSPSVPAPSYSHEPSGDEQRLEHTPSTRLAGSQPTGTFIKKSGKTTIILNDQENGASIPSYGRHGCINGALLFEQHELITEVEFEVGGKIETTLSDSGGRAIKLLHIRQVLWSRPKHPKPTDICPDQLPLDFTLPTTFREGDSTQPLPPSFNSFLHGTPTLFVNVGYHLRIRVTRLVSSKVGRWTKTKHILIPFSYYPRTRPSQPIYPSPGFFSSIKTSPEEWFQATSTLKTRNASSSLDPISCTLFIPAGRVYGLTDSIPFHLQLSSGVSSLRELFSSSGAADSLDRVLSSDSRTTASTSSWTSAKIQPALKPVVRVYLMRQVTVEVRGEKSWRNSVIGEGTLTPVPPLMSSCYDSTSCMEHLDWEGTLKCDDTVKIGGFVIGNIQVKEFVVMNIAPPASSKSPFVSMQTTIPIRIVTDSYGELPASYGTAV